MLGEVKTSPVTAAGEDLLDYAARILGLHDEAMLLLSKTPLSGRINLGLEGVLVLSAMAASASARNSAAE